MRRSTALPLLFSALLALAGCKSPCRELSERLCNCVQQFERDNCIRLVAEQSRSAEPTDEELSVCEQKLDTCNPRPLEEETEQTTRDDYQGSCGYLETDAGKEACGLAR